MSKEIKVMRFKADEFGKIIEGKIDRGVGVDPGAMDDLEPTTARSAFNQADQIVEWLGVGEQVRIGGRVYASIQIAQMLRAITGEKIALYEGNRPKSKQESALSELDNWASTPPYRFRS